MEDIIDHGFRFNPTDKELMSSLLCFVTDHRPIPFQDHIKIVDVYGNQEPWEILGNTTPSQSVLYCFTHLKRRIKKNKQDSLRFERRVGRSVGTWKGQNKGAEIFDNRGRLIGYKKSMRYENKQSCHHGKWLMKEYCLAENLSDKVKHKDFVLCRIKRKGDQEVDHRHQGQSRLCDHKMDEITAALMGDTESSSHGYSVVKNSSESIKGKGDNQVDNQSHLRDDAKDDEWDSEFALELEQELEKSSLEDDIDIMEESVTKFAFELEQELETSSLEDGTDKMEESDTEFALELEKELENRESPHHRHSIVKDSSGSIKGKGDDEVDNQSHLCDNPKDDEWDSEFALELEQELEKSTLEDDTDKMEVSDTEFALELEQELELQSCLDDDTDVMDSHEFALELEQSVAEGNEEMSMEPNSTEALGKIEN